MKPELKQTIADIQTFLLEANYKLYNELVINPDAQLTGYETDCILSAEECIKLAYNSLDTAISK